MTDLVPQMIIASMLSAIATLCTFKAIEHRRQALLRQIRQAYLPAPIRRRSKK